jgi:glycosyltransferase 2 family protein
MARLLRRLLPLLISLAVMAWLFVFRTRPEENLRLAASVPAFWLALAAALCVVSFACQAVRLSLLVNMLGARLPLRKALAYNLLGHFYSAAIPGGSVGGDAVKALYLAREAGGKARAFAAVIVDRLCGLFMLAAVALAAMVLLGHAELARQAGLVVGLFAGGAAAAIVVLTSRRARRLLPARLPLGNAIRAFDEALQLYRGKRLGLLLALLISLLPQAGWIAMHIAIGHGMGVQADWLAYAVVIPAAGMVAALPVSFGGWGVGEAATAHFLAATGDEAARATLYSQGAVLSALGRLLQLLAGAAGALAAVTWPRPRELPEAVKGSPLLEDSRESRSDGQKPRP